jgi:hypothetical protein
VIRICPVGPEHAGELWLVTGASSEENLRLYRRAGNEPVDERVADIGVRLLVLAEPAGGGVSVNSGGELGP